MSNKPKFVPPKFFSLSNYRDIYDHIVSVRIEEMELPDSKRTLKLETFLGIERDIMAICGKYRKYRKKLTENLIRVK